MNNHHNFIDIYRMDDQRRRKQEKDKNHQSLIKSIISSPYSGKCMVKQDQASTHVAGSANMVSRIE